MSPESKREATQTDTKPISNGFAAEVLKQEPTYTTSQWELAGKFSSPAHQHRVQHMAFRSQGALYFWTCRFIILQAWIKKHRNSLALHLKMTIWSIVHSHLVLFYKLHTLSDCFDTSRLISQEMTLGKHALTELKKAIVPLLVPRFFRFIQKVKMQHSGMC